MASGLAALLDDVAAIAKIAAASVDDAAVTPGYAMGFTPDRELPIVWKIAMGSLRNKFFFLLPGALLLSAFAPWLVTPLLMVGGSYLTFEASEKILEAFLPHEAGGDEDDLALSSTELEDQKVAGAIRTDLILSAEIMFIALADVAQRPLAIQAAALAVVGLALTIGVYGVVGLLVKMDDIGLHMARGRTRPGRALGHGLVKAMPALLSGLASIGTAAMLWVGGGILVHGLEHFGWMPIPHLVEGFSHWAGQVPGVGTFTGWLAFAAGSAVVGLAVGAVIVGVLHLIHRLRPSRTH